jgi:cobalamin biosynthesis Mg chelatase CobN
MPAEYCLKKGNGQECQVDIECLSLRCDQNTCSSTKKLIPHVKDNIRSNRRNLQSISRSSSSRSSSSSSRTTTSTSRTSSSFSRTASSGSSIIVYSYSRSSSGSSTTGVIVGPIVSVVFFIICFGCCIYHMKKSG